MFKFNLLGRESEPRREESGRNVEIRLIFIRHGQKDMKDRERGLLTEKGKEQFREFAEAELGDPNRNLIVYGTDIARTLQSGFEAVSNAQSKIKVFPEPLNELSMSIDSHDKTKPQKFSRAFMEKMKSMPPGDNVSYYLTYHDQKPDEGTVSPRELACGIAKIITGYNNKKERFKSDTKTDVVLVSHDFVLRSFLQECLGIKLREGNKNMKPAEFFEIIIKTDDRGGKVAQFKYGDELRVLNIDELQQLISEYEKI